jgi:hypothetical protein
VKGRGFQYSISYWIAFYHKPRYENRGLIFREASMITTEIKKDIDFDDIELQPLSHTENLMLGVILIYLLVATLSLIWLDYKVPISEQDIINMQIKTNPQFTDTVAFGSFLTYSLSFIMTLFGLLTIIVFKRPMALIAALIISSFLFAQNSYSPYVRIMVAENIVDFSQRPITIKEKSTKQLFFSMPVIAALSSPFHIFKTDHINSEIDKQRQFFNINKINK